MQLLYGSWFGSRPEHEQLRARSVPFFYHYARAREEVLTRIITR